MAELVLVGRGPSVYDFREWRRAPLLAVSSGVFAIPDNVEIKHFVTMDPLKFYMADLMTSEIAWSSDGKAMHRAFWRDPLICKHVLRGRLKPATYRRLPEQIWDAIPTQHLPIFQRALTNTLHAFGFQPSWGDQPNVRGWDIEVDGAPNFGVNGMGDRLGIDGVRNSWLMAVQIAARLGFKHLSFVGCDFRHSCYDAIIPTIERWYEIARVAGITWVNLSSDSRLADIMPTEVAA